MLINKNKISLDNAGIIYNPHTTGYEKTVEDIQKELEKVGIQYSITSVENLNNDVTFAIVAGGDGTILKAARYYSRYSTPVFGINLGRLGFLAQSSPCEIEKSIQKIINNEIKIEDRLMITANPGRLIALNDIVIKNENISRTARIEVSINGNKVCDYISDGIIISTPTGSTAYNISVGGPILTPSLNAFIIIPICPHALNTRPLVIPSYEKIKITSEDNTRKLRMIADGQNMYSIPENSTITIKKHKNKAKLILMNNHNFYSVLQQKLNWGTRNTK